MHTQTYSTINLWIRETKPASRGYVQKLISLILNNRNLNWLQTINIVNNVTTYRPNNLSNLQYIGWSRFVAFGDQKWQSYVCDKTQDSD